MRVLLIEDDRASMDLARRVIELLGHTVLLAEDGPEGLALASTERPDAMVVDMRLPTLDGWVVVRECRRDYPTMRIVAVSAGLAGERERAIAAGCDAFVEKPYNLDVLRAAIGTLVTDKRCPRCGESVKLVASSCRFCGFAFDAPAPAEA